MLLIVPVVYEQHDLTFKALFGFGPFGDFVIAHEALHVIMTTPRKHKATEHPATLQEKKHIEDGVYMSVRTKL